MLAAIVDGHWLAEHPDRAPVLGGHGGDAHEQLMADALLELTGIEAFGATATGDGNHQTDATADPAHQEPSAGGPGVPANELQRRRTANARRARAAKATVVIVFDVDKYQADMLGVGPVPVTETLFDLAKADLYYSFVNMHGEILKFGRARRDPTPLQRLAVMARDRTCFFRGCNVPATQCEIHHMDEWLRDIGFTDVDALIPCCYAHHDHVHLEKLVVQRERDGSVTIRERATGIIIALTTPKRAAAA